MGTGVTSITSALRESDPAEAVTEALTEAATAQRAGSATPAARLRYLQTVPRTMVHRAAMAEVFITDAVPTGPDRYLVAAQWPRDHALYHPDRTGRTDPLLLAETLRQALVYLAHRYHDVPLTHRFIGSGMDFAVTDSDALRVGAAPLPVVLEARWVWTANRPPRRYGMRLDVVLTVGGRVCGHGSLEVLAVDARTYGILRGRVPEPDRARADGSGAGPDDHPSAPAWRQVPAARVGRLRGKDSVLEEYAAEPGGAVAPGGAVTPGGGLAPGGTAGSGGAVASGGTAVSGLSVTPGGAVTASGGVTPGSAAAKAWRMRADLRHAILFDHPSDHLPLMVTLEGCRQLGYLLAHDGAPDRPYALASCAVECSAFAELSPPVELVATEQAEPASADGRRSLRIEAVQAGRTVAVTRSVWAPVRRC